LASQTPKGQTLEPEECSVKLGKEPGGQPPKTSLERTWCLVALPWGYFSEEHNSYKETKNIRLAHAIENFRNV
jgi:hypothetical protein